MKNELKRILNVVLRQRTQRRIWAAALAVCMTVTMMPIQTYAVETVQTVETVEDTGGLCEHHTEHTPECGYTEAAEGSPCMHIAEGKEHSEDCYKTVEDCIHKHTADCYDDAATELASDSNAGDPVNCAHMCSEDTGCITKKPDCPHEKNSHDDECGYVAESEGTPCTFVCERCNGITEESAAVKAVQVILDRLPAIEALPDPDSENFAEYLDTLKGDVEAARRGYDALTEEEKPMLTSAGLEKLAALEELLANVPMLMAEGTRITNEAELKAMTSSGTYYLANNIRLESAWTPLPKFSGTLDGNEYTISNLEVTTSDMYAGFIASLDKTGTIKNLTVNGTIESTCTGSGRSGGIVGKNAGTIIDCTFWGEVWSGAGENHAVGGICGLNDTGTITGCTNNGKVAGKGDPQEVYVGGITGSNKGTINNSTNSGSISAESTATKIYQGDLVGSYTWVLGSCYIGGITGDSGKNGVTNCTNSGSITVNGFTSHTCNGITFDKVLTAAGGTLAAGNYYLDSDVTLTNTLTSSGTVNLCLNGHTLTGADGSRIITIAGGTLGLYDCSTNHTGKITGSNSGGVTVDTGVFNLYSGSIADISTSMDNGSGVCVGVNGTFNMTGGVISGNTVTGSNCNGGGVYIKGKFWMTGGKITGNSTTGSNGSGGGIYVAADAKSAQISGTAEISGNSVNGIGGKGGGVYMGRDFNLAGAVKITGNTEVTSGTALQSNLYLPSTKALVTQTFTGSIGVTVSNPPSEGNTYDVAEGSSYTLTEDDAKCFVSDAVDYEIKLENGCVVLQVRTEEAEYTPIGGQTCTGSLSDALTAITANGGSIKLLTDVSSAGVVLPAKPVSIDLNGKNWTTSESIRVIDGSTLTVNDLTTEKTGIITANTGRVVYIDAGGTLNLMGGTLSCTVERYEAINNSGTVNISGGKATTVGTYAVNNRTDGTFRLTGGSVETTKNYAALGNAGTSYISDGTISSAAVHAVTNSIGGTLHLSGGTLSGNSPTDPTISNQGEIYLSGNPTLSSITDTHISMSDVAATLTANNGKTDAELVYSESKVKVSCPSTATAGYVAVQGLRDQTHSTDFSVTTAPAGLEYQYNDTDKQIKLVTKIPKYALTVTNGTITSSDTSGTYEKDTSVTVTANTAPNKQQFKEWTATGLTNATYTTNPLTVTMPANVVTLTAVYELIPTYTITASPTEKDFGSLEKGYTPPEAETITVTNTGNTGVTLTQPTNANYTIGTLSSTTVATGDTATFTIQPRPGLAEGVYNTAIIISTDHSTSTTVNVKFTVTPPSITDFTFTATSGLKEEQDNVKPGAVAGIFSAPQGGTEPFTYALASNSENDTDNGKFTIDGTSLKVGSSALTEGTYKAYVQVSDTKGKTFGKAITITVTEADPRYTITASPATKDFGKLVEDYPTPPAAQTITVTNTGNQTMTLTQPTGTNFTIGALSKTTIERDETATFTIQPKPDLTEKKYSEIITINTGNSTSATVTAKFEVTLPVIDGYTFTQTAGLQEEKTNAEAGAVAGTFSDPKGGTGAFTYTLTAQAGDDTDNGRFEIAGTNLKVKGNALTEGTYKAYVLATDTKGKTFGKAITITVAKADPRYTITASPTDKDFGSVRRKYTAPAAQTITITNTGNQTMTLTPPTSTNYVIGALSSTTIARDKTATFTIQPKTGLAEGVYDETITINTGNGTSATVAVKFTVTSALVYDLTVNGSYAESTGAGTYEGDATVNINAGTRSRYTFTGWTSSGGGTFADAGSASTTFTMPEGNVTITAAWRYNGGGGGGGGSSSGGSGSSGGSTTPPPSQPVVKIPGTGQATIPTTVDQNGNANVSVTDKNITDAIADAKKDAVQGQPITVEIKVNTDKDASQLITTLPQSVRDTLINNQVGSLTIGSKDVSMKFSQAALSQMNAQAQGNLIITATKADTGKLMGNAQTLIGNHPTYEFKATCDGRIITDLGANAVTITIPYILKEGETAVNVQAFRVDANGVATVVPGSYYDVTKQTIVFATGDISATYGVGYRQAAASVAHRVQRGETLAMIARRYQTTVQAIAAINGISNPDRIEIGQEIQIPQ